MAFFHVILVFTEGTVLHIVVWAVSICSFLELLIKPMTIIWDVVPVPLSLCGTVHRTAVTAVFYLEKESKIIVSLTLIGRILIFFPCLSRQSSHPHIPSLFHAYSYLNLASEGRAHLLHLRLVFTKSIETSCRKEFMLWGFKEWVLVKHNYKNIIVMGGVAVEETFVAEGFHSYL